MGIFNRLLLFIYSLFITVISIVLLGVCTTLIPERYWLNELHFAIGRPETIAALVVLLLFSIHFLGRVFSRSKKIPATKEITLNSAQGGAVQVEVEAIRSLSEKAAMSISGVRSVLVKVQGNSKEALRVRLNLMIGTSASVADVSEKVRASVSEQLQGMLDIENVPVDINVTDMSNAPVAKRRVV